MSYDKKLAKWLQKGIKKGWISDVDCSTHDGPDMTEEELEEFDKGFDPCIPIVRLWID